MQKCRVCLVEKSLNDFPKNYTYKNGVATICKMCSAIDIKSRRDTSPHIYKASKFKTSPEYMQELLKITKCEICGDTAPPHRKHLAVDHNHITGKIRGMLCDPCNLALGKFKDSVIILEKAISYLKERNEKS